MKKRKTLGENVARTIQTLDPGGMLAHSRVWREKIARRIDAAIRRAQAAAFDAGQKSGMALMAEDSDGDATNPYRKARKS